MSQFGTKKRVVFSTWGSFGDLYPVLNALRHHQNLHASLPEKRVRVLPRCSTPFGIIGIFTFASALARDPDSPCSTPFGIIGIFTSRGSRGLSQIMAVL